MTTTNRRQPRVARVSTGESKKTNKSGVFEALHRSASALNKVGAMDSQTLRNLLQELEKYGPEV